MEMFLMFVKAFFVGGMICVIGQILINYTKLTTGRILVIFMLLGVFLEAVGAYKFILEWSGAGASVPILGFGSSLAKGAIEGAKEGLFGAVTGGLKSAAMGVTAAIVFGYLNALLFRSRTKKR